MSNFRKRTNDSRILDTVHEMAKGLYDGGVIEATTLREYEALCLPPVKDFTPREIKGIRLRERVSQSVLAKFLNTSVSTVRQWEQGDKHPRGTSLKLLNLIADKGLGVLA